MPCRKNLANSPTDRELAESTMKNKKSCRALERALLEYTGDELRRWLLQLTDQERAALGAAVSKVLSLGYQSKSEAMPSSRPET